MSVAACEIAADTLAADGKEASTAWPRRRCEKRSLYDL
jgi:hypothetical protein